MRRLFGVLLIVLAMIWVRQIGSVEVASGAEPSGVALALGFCLVVALVTGELFRRLRLPRLTGYLLFGVLVGPYLGNLVNESMARQLQVINGIATTLIAFIAGLTLNLERIGPRVTGIARLTITTLGVAMFGLGAVAWVTWSWLPVAPDATGIAKLSMVVLLAIVTVSFSPTMAAAVISETGSRGRLSDLVLAIVVFADLIVLVLFSIALQGARFVFGQAGDGEVNVLIRLAWEIGGAVAFGSLIGALFALYLRYVAREVTVVLIGVCVVLSQVGLTGRVEPLLAALAAGTGDRERGGGAGRCAQDRAAAGRAARARRLLRGGGHIAPARCPHAARGRGCAPGPRARRAHPPRCRGGPAHVGHPGACRASTCGRG